MNQALSLTLLDVAKLTWSKVPHKGDRTFPEYCKFLLDQKEDIWIICTESGSLSGMIAAKNTDARLYVTMFVTLMPGCFERFISLAEDHFGKIKELAYLRRGREKAIDFRKFKEKALNYE